MTSRRRFLAAGAGLGLAPVVGDLGALGGAAGDLRDRTGDPYPHLPSRRAAEVILGLVGDMFLLQPFPAPPAEATRRAVDVLAGCDLAIGNLENGLSTVGSPELGGMRYGPSLRGAPELVSELGTYHIQAVSLANNHTGNFGPEALLETTAVLDRAGIAHAGAGADAAAALRAARLRAGSLTVGLISAYSFIDAIEANDIARPDRPGIAGCRAHDVVLASETGLDVQAWRPDTRPAWLVPPRPNPSRTVVAAARREVDALAAAVIEARDAVDFLIVSFHIHWGRHYRADLPFHQQALARAMVDAGADMVVAHGPHVLRGVEVYRDRPIAYSLANFLLAPVAPEDRAGRLVRGDPYRESVILRARLARGSTTLELIPILIGLDGRPGLVPPGTGTELLERMAGLTANVGTVMQIQDGIGRVTIPAGAVPL